MYTCTNWIGFDKPKSFSNCGRRYVHLAVPPHCNERCQNRPDAAGTSIDGNMFSVQHAHPVPSRKETPPAESHEVASLRDEVADLKNQVHMLSDILDEIREELQWVTRNGLPIHVKEPLPPVPVLKRMAADPCAPDWAERLVVDYGTPPRVDESEANSQPSAEPARDPSTPGKPPAGKLFAEPRDQARLF